MGIMSAMQRSIFVSSFAILVGNKLVVCNYKSNWGGESKYQCVHKKKLLMNERSISGSTDKPIHAKSLIKIKSKMVENTYRGGHYDQHIIINIL